MTISRILHAGYLFQSNETQIIFDPIFENPFSRNCYSFPEIEFNYDEIQKLNLDAIFISHFHDDHCSFESLNLLDRNIPIYIFCIFPEMIDWLNQLGFHRVYPLKLNKSVYINDFEIITRRALDESVDSIFQIKGDGLNILNVVDSWIDYETMELLCSEKPFDLILWPFQTMREIQVLSPESYRNELPEIPSEWIEQLKQLQPRCIIPSSCQFKFEEWSWYNQAFFPITYKFFKEEINKALPESLIVRLDPGYSLELNTDSVQSAHSISWIKRLNEAQQDYEYLPHIDAPTTREVAKKLPRVSNDEKELIFNFCNQEIFDRFKLIDFEFPNLYWNLKLFDEEGVEYSFHYKIQKNILSKMLDEYVVAWKTEIPIVKLYGALQQGESLTSLYIRIQAPDGFDVMDDPLLKTLFSNEFGTYQKSQLQKIKDTQ